MNEIRLPELGEGITKATVACWFARPGDEVKEDDDVAEVVTDKASFSIQAPANGRIREILVAQGKDAAVGQVLARLE